MSGLGPSFMKIWTGGSSPRSGCPNAWRRIKKRKRSQPFEQLLEFFRRDPNYFPSSAIGYHFKDLIISLWTGNKQQSMEWGHSASPHPKISECKNPLEKFSPWFFGIKTVSSLLIIVQRTKLSRRNITHLCWCKWSTFEGKTPKEVYQECLVVARHFSGSPDTCKPEENCPTWASIVLITHHILRICPVGIPPVPWTEKKRNEIWPFFFGREGHCCRRDLVRRIIFWHFFLGG